MDMSLHRTMEFLEEWLNIPQDSFESTVLRFGLDLEGFEVLEAAEIARTKFPDGGMSGFRYFCGVCHRKIEARRIRRYLE